MAQSQVKLKARRIEGANWVGLYTFIQKEVARFMVVYVQAIVAPAITTLLFYAVFALAFGGLERDMNGIPFLQFLVPGLIMMNMAQNAFANSSTSLIIAKVQGNIVDTVMPPLSAGEILAGFIIGSVTRGTVVGLATAIALAFFAPVSIYSLLMTVLFGFLGCAMLGSLGLIAGIWSEKFDHIAVFTNFLVMPLTFLSGTFYSVRDLPEMWHAIAHYNPFFYMIDGFRYGFIGRAEGELMIGIILLLSINFVFITTAYIMLRTGYKIKT